MAIKGVSEVVRLPRLGKIRLGIKKETNAGVTYPTPTDYFVCPDEVRKIFGEKPKELRVMFPTEDESQWSSQYLRCYSASRGLICRGDGESALARIDVSTGEIAAKDAINTELKEITCRPDDCPYYERGQCKKVMNLQFLLPDCPGFGVYQLDTSSFNSIVNINSTLKLIRGICGRLSMIPLSLKLVEQEVQPEGRKKTVRVLNLSAPYSLTEIQRYARLPAAESLILPPPDSEAPDDLFPDGVLDNIKPPTEFPEVDTEMLWLWDKVKGRIWQLDISDSQIADWFQRTYKLIIGLADFEAPKPPSQLTREQLAHFYKAIEHYSITG